MYFSPENQYVHLIDGKCMYQSTLEWPVAHWAAPRIHRALQMTAGEEDSKSCMLLWRWPQPVPPRHGWLQPIAGTHSCSWFWPAPLWDNPSRARVRPSAQAGQVVAPLWRYVWDGVVCAKWRELQGQRREVEEKTNPSLAPWRKSSCGAATWIWLGGVTLRGWDVEWEVWGEQKGGREVCHRWEFSEVFVCFFQYQSW